MKYLVGIFVLIAIDLISKFYIAQNMALYETLHIMPYFALHYTHNTGIAFSMFAGADEKVLIFVAIAILCFVGWLWWQTDRAKKLANFGFVLIFAGAIGNIIDRLLNGYVIDFFLFYVGNWQFAVFNMADSYITIGAIIIIFDEIILSIKKPKLNDGEQNMSDTFKAIVIKQDDAKKQSVEIVQMPESELMEGDVTLQVQATTVNYKDGLAITGKAPVVRKWPMIPGIDIAGEVIESQNSEFKQGDSVILNGWGVGEKHFGGFAQKARVKGEWLIHRPENITAGQAMAIGTAGYTAMLCVMALERHNITPERGAVIVSGANGGVGSVAVSLLSKLGYEVVATTRRTNEAEFLKSLGASEIIDASEMSQAGSPLAKEKFAAGIDAVGSHTLANMLAQIKYGGCVAACGLAQGHDLPATVMPFILRGVCLLGIDSVMAPKAIRQAAWARLSQDLDMAKLESLSQKITFDDLIESANNIVAGKIRGRVVCEF